MGDLQDPTDGATLVPYFWPYFLVIFPEMAIDLTLIFCYLNLSPPGVNHAKKTHWNSMAVPVTTAKFPIAVATLQSI